MRFLAFSLLLLVAQPAHAEADYTEPARLLYRDVACGGPAAAAPSSHCAAVTRLYQQYREKWLAPAQELLRKIVPAGLPAQVVYPFGGGDLLSALATFPDATEYTIISLEPAGDLHKAKNLRNAAAMAPELRRLRKNLGNLMSVAHSKTVNLDDEAKGLLPGQIVFSLVALAVFGYEPTSVRYFRLGADGALSYVDLSDDVEIRFRRAGDASAPEKTMRHISFNLDDHHLAADPSLLKHLETKGKVTAMTKAASHLLWIDSFSKIRGYLLGHMAWMISDSTGIPPRYGRAAGFTYEGYGQFKGPAHFGPINDRDAKDFRELFTHASPLPFRAYGYPDSGSHAHVIVTRPQ